MTSGEIATSIGISPKKCTGSPSFLAGSGMGGGPLPALSIAAGRANTWRLGKCQDGIVHVVVTSTATRLMRGHSKGRVSLPR